MRKLIWIGLAAMLLAPAGAFASTGKCFFDHEFESWRAPDDHTIYIRAGVNDYYRLDLAGTCPALKWPNAHLVTHFRGSDSVCSGLDWDLKVAQDGPGNVPVPCIVKTQTPLSDADVKAIPPRFKP